MENQKKEHIKACDFMRAVCALGIVLYHYSIHIADANLQSVFQFRQIEWSDVIVTIFFMISGAMLYYNYPVISSLKGFYYKRWKSIFPFFYMIFIPKFLINVIRYKSFFYLGNPLGLLLSLLGIDGYFSYRFDSYYMMGEWFLGAIILLYLLYPVVLWLFQKSAVITTLLSVAGYVFVLCTDIFTIDPLRNLLSCLMCFTLGMLFMKYKKQLKCLPVGILSLMIVVLVCILETELPVYPVTRYHLVGIFLFVALFYLGDFVMKVPYLSKGLSEISNISFPIFLLHHLTILQAVEIYMPTTSSAKIIEFFIVLTIILVASKILCLVVKWICKTTIYKKLEEKFIGSNSPAKSV